MPKLLQLLDHPRLPILLIPLTFCYFLVGFDRHPNIYDEGLAVYGAARVLQGDIPYKDFWSTYAPGQFYTLALLFRLFGTSLRHDQLFINDAMFYFLAGRECATRYHELHPGVATTRPVQEEIVADLERARVRYIVLRYEECGQGEPNESFRSSGVTRLDDYIRANFAPLQAFDRYSVWQRKPRT